MSRPPDWWVLDLAGDPVPGDPSTVSGVAARWSQVASDADTARAQISSLLGDQAVMAWLGKAGDAFRSHSSKLPGQLQKCSESYQQAASALMIWSGQLDGHQQTADRALALGRAAAADLASAQGQLSGAQSSASSAQSAVNGYQATTRQAAHDTAVPAPDPAQVRAAVARAGAASQAVCTAQHAVGDAQARLDAAKRMAAQAAAARDGDGHTTATRLHQAADAGIPPDSFWHKLGNDLAKAWHILVQIAKIVVIIGGIIALIIGGPIAWIVFAAALIVLADTLAKYAQGKATLLDVGLAALSCIPCTKGLTTLAELSDAFKAGGLLGAGSHLLVSGKNAAIGFLRTAQCLRVGLAPATVAIISSLGDATADAADASGLRRLTVFYGALNDVRKEAVTTAWTAYRDALGATDAARSSEVWQGSREYPGVDAASNDVLPPGTGLEAADPGLSGYVVPAGTFDSVGNDAAAYARGVQVGPNPQSFWGEPLRPRAVRFVTTEHVPVGASTASANPQYGPGGLDQYYVPGFAQRVVNHQINAVDGAGNVLPASLTPDGHLVIHLSAGDAIELTNFHDLPPVPTIQQVAAARPYLHQTGSRLVSTAWSAEQLARDRR